MEIDNGAAPPLSVSAVAAATGYSVQQIRTLEALGVLAPAARAGNGYRQFTAHHVRDLLTYRDLAHAIGPVAARRTMTRIRVLPSDEALAVVSDFHRDLHVQRSAVLAALDALEAIRAEPSTDDVDSMTIGQLSDALGVQPSTLRFWEHEGMIAPERVTLRAVSARRYPPAAIREARITAALRSAGHRIPDVRDTIAAIRELGELEHPTEVLHGRLRRIADNTRSLLRAGAALVDIIEHRPSSNTVRHQTPDHDIRPMRR